MISCRGDMIGGLNSFFEDQAKVEGECVVDYVQFDTVYDLVFTDAPVSEARAVLDPRGGTALIDAMGRAITELGAKLRAQPESERPGTVIVVVITDGQENSSREWSATSVKELIKNQEDKYDWKFTFLGANIDAVKVGAQFGFNPDNSLTYNTKNSRGTTNIMSNNITSTRLTGVSVAYSAAERSEAMSDKDTSESNLTPSK